MRRSKVVVSLTCCALGFVLSQSPAEALLISYGDVHPSTLTDWGPFSYTDIPQFNPALGTLNLVDITLSGSMQSDMTLKNNSTSNTTVIGGSSFVQLDAQFAGLNFSSFMNDLIPGTPFTVFGDEEKTISLGTSGIDQKTFTAPVDDLSIFIGTGFLGHSWTSLGGWAVTALGGNTVATVTTFSDARIDVIYDYTAPLTPPPSDPVPEPGTILLLSSGLVGLAGRSFRKKKAVS